jgi:hypothetical protein
MPVSMPFNIHERTMEILLSDITLVENERGTIGVAASTGIVLRQIQYAMRRHHQRRLNN